MTNFLRRYVFHHLGLKIVSVLVAFGLWLVVTRNPIAETEVSVPIEFHHIPDNLEISSENIPQAQVRVRGPERAIRQLSAADIHVEIDLAGTPAGERTFDLTAQQVREPRELEVVQLVPSQFHIAFDTRMTRQIDVRPRVTGSFASGLRIARVTASPATIMISGPRKRVEMIEAATTDPVDASGAMDRASFTTHAYVSDPLVQVVQPGPIRVTIIMEKTTGTPGGM
jgi:diadenylate cyclase